MISSVWLMVNSITFVECLQIRRLANCFYTPYYIRMEATALYISTASLPKFNILFFKNLYYYPHKYIPFSDANHLLKHFPRPNIYTNE